MQIKDHIALAHIDGDWYESVKTCLERIEPHLVSGGVLVIDDYDAWSGCRTAVDEYFSDKKNLYQYIRKARLHLVRK
jgi:predicted O-methyltransferase YrrM